VFNKHLLLLQCLPYALGKAFILPLWAFIAFRRAKAGSRAGGAVGHPKYKIYKGWMIE
jgi:hypothetical protein